MIDLDLAAIQSRLDRGVESLTDTYDLLREVKRLRGEVERERAAVVAWLRVAWGAVNLVSTDIVSAEIERGEHRRKGDE